MPSMTPGQRAPDMNLAPGIVVDKVAVNPELNEFYLQSHKALQVRMGWIVYVAL